jgi:hypothetical protein
MQTKVLSAAVLAVALLAANGASAAEGFRAQAKLVTPVAAPTAQVISSVEWKCDGDACLGVSKYAPGLDSFMKQCRKVRAALGPLAAYSSRGIKMSDIDVANCNTGPR